MSMAAHEPRLAARDPDLRGLRILVVGLGRSGLAALRLANVKGARLTASDSKPEERLATALSEARRLGAEVHAGGNPPALAAAADLIVVSPGVPPEIDLLGEARRLGVPVWGEIELGARFCQGRVIGVTGSNGKSTVTSMLGTVLRGAGLTGGTGGNLGLPFCDLLADDAPDAVHAVELSSFQLETLQSLRPAIAVLLNLSPDHLDRYRSYADYARAKQRLLELQEPGADAVLNADDRESDRFHAAVRGRLHLFSTRLEPERGAFLREGRLVLRTEHGEETLLGLAELPLPGEHNAANALAAALAARLAGCPAAAIAAGLRSYKPLPHRLERVAAIGGVDFYNDSKATNPDSAARGLASFEPGRVHLILGGRDKGGDWEALVPEIRRYAKRLLLVGEAAPALHGRLSGAAPMLDCGTVARAVRAGFEGAVPGDVVLLSPGCASFDQYSNFEERGEDFRRAVRSLAAEEGADA